MIAYGLVLLAFAFVGTLYLLFAEYIDQVRRRRARYARVHTPNHRTRCRVHY